MEKQHTNEQLCELIQQGRTELLFELWSQNEPFIKSLAKTYAQKFPGKQDLLDDCVQQTYIELPKIVTRYKLERCSFLTFLKYSLRSVFRSVMFETGGRGRRAENDLLNHCFSLDAFMETDEGQELAIQISDEHARMNLQSWRMRISDEHRTSLSASAFSFPATRPEKRS